MPEAKKSNKGLIIGILAGAVAIAAAVVVILIIVLTQGHFEAGTYKLTKVVEKGTEITGDALSLIGGETTMTLKEDGTGTVKSGSGTYDITWDKDKKTLTTEGTEYSVEVSGNSFTIKFNDELSQTFTKQ